MALFDEHGTTWKRHQKGTVLQLNRSKRTSCASYSLLFISTPMDNAVVANVFGTLGAVLWSLQVRV